FQVGGTDLGQDLCGDGRTACAVDGVLVGSLGEWLLQVVDGRARGDDRDRGGLGGMRLGEDTLQVLLVLGQYILGFFLRDVAAANQGLGVQLAGRALGFD